MQKPTVSIVNINEWKSAKALSEQGINMRELYKELHRSKGAAQITYKSAIDAEEAAPSLKAALSLCIPEDSSIYVESIVLDNTIWVRLNWPRATGPRSTNAKVAKPQAKRQ